MTVMVSVLGSSVQQIDVMIVVSGLMMMMMMKMGVSGRLAIRTGVLSV